MLRQKCKHKNKNRKENFARNFNMLMFSGNLLKLHHDHNFYRLFTTSGCRYGFHADVYKWFKSKIVTPEMLDKRPSDVEIKKKDLPLNTPTLRHRIARSESHKFMEYTKSGGYHLGPTGTWVDYVNANMTLKEFCQIGANQIIDEFKKIPSDIKDIRATQHKITTQKGIFTHIDNYHIFFH